MSPDAVADHALLTVSTWQRSASAVTVRLYHLDGRPWASAGFLPPFQPGAKWAWIRETVARECGVNEDQVGCIESDDGDVITVDGMPCYSVS
ncbi:hypothetical protein ACWX0K_15165 [Nitrobacteraceae bacterium UC4446_H13]